ncbi:hypothetical protein ACLQ3H_06045 [Micromonospora saelicesensis]|uniref:hypothetical protein n=1 Tax=Micromonospora saelicesensis TaxID=285676 RepID=UPI003CE912A2
MSETSFCTYTWALRRAGCESSQKRLATPNSTWIALAYGQRIDAIGQAAVGAVSAVGVAAISAIAVVLRKRPTTRSRR